MFHVRVDMVGNGRLLSLQPDSTVHKRYHSDRTYKTNYKDSASQTNHTHTHSLLFTSIDMSKMQPQAKRHHASARLLMAQHLRQQ